MTEGDERVTLAGASGSDETEILRATNPLETGEIVERGARDRALNDVELLQCLGDRNPASLRRATCAAKCFGIMVAYSKIRSDGSGESSIRTSTDDVEAEVKLKIKLSGEITDERFEQSTGRPLDQNCTQEKVLTPIEQMHSRLLCNTPMMTAPRQTNSSKLRKQKQEESLSPAKSGLQSSPSRIR